MTSRFRILSQSIPSLHHMVIPSNRRDVTCYVSVRGAVKACLEDAAGSEVARNLSRIPLLGMRPTTPGELFGPSFDASLPQSLHSRLTACKRSQVLLLEGTSETAGYLRRAERHNVSPTETVDAKNKDGVKREISVEIPAEEVTRELERIILKYQKVARLPRFRSGHVPASIIRQR